MKVSPRILLVDHESDFYRVFSRFLSRVGFKVTLVRDQGEAMSLLAGGRYDILITNQHSDQLDNVSLLEWIKAHRPQMKIYVISQARGASLWEWRC